MVNQDEQHIYGGGILLSKPRSRTCRPNVSTPRLFPLRPWSEPGGALGCSKPPRPLYETPGNSAQGVANHCERSGILKSCGRSYHRLTAQQRHPSNNIEMTSNETAQTASKWFQGKRVPLYIVVGGSLLSTHPAEALRTKTLCAKGKVVCSQK